MRKFFLALLTTFAVAVSPAFAADALKDVNPAPIPGEEILFNQAICDGIYRSAKLGREVEISIPEI